MPFVVLEYERVQKLEISGLILPKTSLSHYILFFGCYHGNKRKNIFLKSDMIIGPKDLSNKRV